MNRWSGKLARRVGVQYHSVNTFRLLWCEGCGHAEEPPLLPEINLVGPVVLPCGECGEALTLLEACVDGTYLRDRPGQPMRYVAHLDDISGS